MFSRGGFLVDFLQSFEMIFEALGGQEHQKGNKMGHNGGDGRVLVAKAVLARKMECMQLRWGLRCTVGGKVLI